MKLLNIILDLSQRVNKISDRRLALVLLMLTLPAFLWNLDVMAFIGDEGIRSLVALEMKLSGNYIMPTLNGEPYFNKPPLYNWILLLTAWLGGGFGEWPARLTTLFFLGCFAWSVYRFHRRYFDEITALSAAFMLLTCGRILFWDSMLGLIDICFSWVIYLNFTIWYAWSAKERWRQLFIISYLLGAIAFLLKGFPAIVFQGLIVLTGLYFRGVLSRYLISRAHFAGIELGLLIGLGYYGLYARYQSLDVAFAVLLEQSMQRTPTNYSWQQTLLHLFTFPFEQVYHFLPWSLLIVIFFHPKFWSWVGSKSMQSENPIARFSFLQLIVNIPVYWASVGIFPRYLLMFVPLFNTIGLYSLQKALENGKTQWQSLLQYTFALMTGLGTLTLLALPLVERGQQLSYWPAIWIGGGSAMALVTLALLTDPRRMFLWLAAGLLVFRIGFDGMILPFRSQDDVTTITRIDANRLAEKWGDREWRIYKKTELHQVARFYTTNALQKIIRKSEKADDPNAFYFVDTSLYPNFYGEQIDSIRLESGHYLALMHIR